MKKLRNSPIVIITPRSFNIMNNLIKKFVARTKEQRDVSAGFARKTILDISLPQKNQSWLIISLLFIGIVSRLIPHMPNATAIMFSSLTFGFLLPKTRAIAIVLVMGVISDSLLSYLHAYPVFGYWSFFTYSGFLVVTCFGSKIQKITVGRGYGYLLSVSFLFWLWTNFGTWLVSGLYPTTGTGLVACYIAALPFLGNQLLGDVLWLGALFAALGVIKLRNNRRLVGN